VVVVVVVLRPPWSFRFDPRRFLKMMMNEDAMMCARARDVDARVFNHSFIHSFIHNHSRRSCGGYKSSGGIREDALTSVVRRLVSDTTTTTTTQRR
jgi:hypothetical protein